MANLKLYNYWRSSCSYRVRIALALKNLPYEYQAVDIYPKSATPEARAAYRAVNPQGYVPALVDGDFTVGQSLAILEYLEAAHPAPPLLPADARRAAQVRAFCLIISADTQPFQNLSTLAALTERFGASEEQRTAWVRHWNERGLKSAQGALPPGETRYCFGDTPTLADCCLVPQMYSLKRFGGSLAGLERLVAITDRLNALPAFAAAAPERQPDAPR